MYYRSATTLSAELRLSLDLMLCIFFWFVLLFLLAGFRLHCIVRSGINIDTILAVLLEFEHLIIGIDIDVVVVSEFSAVSL